MFSGRVRVISNHFARRRKCAAWGVCARWFSRVILNWTYPLAAASERRSRVASPQPPAPLAVPTQLSPLLPWQPRREGVARRSARSYHPVLWRDGMSSALAKWMDGWIGISPLFLQTTVDRWGSIVSPRCPALFAINWSFLKPQPPYAAAVILSTKLT